MGELTKHGANWQKEMWYLYWAGNEKGKNRVDCMCGCKYNNMQATNSVLKLFPMIQCHLPKSSVNRKITSWTVESKVEIIERTKC